MIRYFYTSWSGHHHKASYCGHHTFCSVVTSQASVLGSCPLFPSHLRWVSLHFPGFRGNQLSCLVEPLSCLDVSVCGIVYLVILPSVSCKLKSLPFCHWGQLHVDFLSFDAGHLVLYRFCPSSIAGVIKPTQYSGPGVSYLSQGCTLRQFPAFGS